MNAYPYFLLAFGSALWAAPFFLNRNKGQILIRIEKRARWGVLLQCFAYSILWQGDFWNKSPQRWRTTVALCFFVLACLISWTAAVGLV